jgi:CRISPR-associated protein Cmr4
MTNAARTKGIIGLLAETPIHAGAAESRGVIDLPVQREAHTAWPCVYGSGVKGAWREAAELYAGTDEGKNSKVIECFGPEQGTGYGGALHVSDAMVLLLPVRSLDSHFRWVTCPSVLDRHKRLCQMFVWDACYVIPEVQPSEVQCGTAERGTVYLEEFAFARADAPVSDDVLTHLARIAGDQPGVDMLRRRIAVVHDDWFRYMCEHAMPDAPHVRLDNESKKVIGRHFWQEEFLPPDTLLYVGVRAIRSLGEDHPMQAAEVFRFGVDEVLCSAKYLRLGGNESTGMGWCRVASPAAT